MEKEYKDIPFIKAVKAFFTQFTLALICVYLYLEGTKYYDPYYTIKDEFREKDAFYKV